MNLLGLESPFRRFIFGALCGTSFLFIVKPRISVNQDNTYKSFLFGENSTFFPWWAWIILPALSLSLFL